MHLRIHRPGAVLAAAALSMLSVQAGAADRFISIATGGTAGIYFPLGGAMGKLWTDNIPGIQATAEVTGASVENTRLVVSEEAFAAIGTGNVVYEAYNGSGRFEKRGAQPVLAIGALYPNAIQIATLAGSGITGLEDLKGKRVSVGAPGSGTEVMNNDVFGALGMSYDAFATAARLSYAETTAAMKDGNLDAGSLSVGLGASALLDLASTRDMELVCMTPDEVDRITAAFPYYSPFTIPGGTYPGVEADCLTIQVANHLFVRADADEDLVHQMTKVLYENTDKLVQTSKAATTVSPAYAMESTVVPLHPGAVRYYREAGVEVPAKVLKDGADAVGALGITPGS
jgi:TRAP transporter TAXI family solute receptor